MTAAEFEQAMDEDDPDEALARANLPRQKGGRRTTNPTFGCGGAGAVFLKEIWS